MLALPSSRAFEQSLRLRRNNLPRNVVLLVVEGSTDKRALIPHLTSDVRVVVSSNKEHSLGAYNGSIKEPIGNCLFFIDCDGSTEEKYKGQLGLVLTHNRDIEADLLFELGALGRVANEYLYQKHDTVSEIERESAAIMDFVRDFSASFGVILDAARANGSRVRIAPPDSGKARRMRIFDIAASDDWFSSLKMPSVAELCTSMAEVAGWQPWETDLILNSSIEGAKKLCRIHEKPGCPECRARRYSNGHDLVDGVKYALSAACSVDISVGELARGFRMSSERSLVEDWVVVERTRRWSDQVGMPVFVSP